MSAKTNKKLIMIAVAVMAVAAAVLLCSCNPQEPTSPVIQNTSGTTTVPTTDTPTTLPTTDATTTPPTTPGNPAIGQNDPFTITVDGVGKATVVISKNYTDKSVKAANDLIDYVKRISGADLEFAYDDGTMAPDRFYILVGPSKFTQQVGVKQPTGYPDNEKLIVKRVNNALVLIGNDDGAFTGTQFAVTRFLEELGCGWFGTAALWQVVPENPSITIEQMDIVETPKFIARENRLTTFNSQSYELSKRWYMGGVETLVGQHYLMTYVDVMTYRAEHPEWYAKDADGNYLEPTDGWWQFCYSNAGLHQKVADVVIDYFNKHPYCMVFTITPNDGSRVGICQCAGCKCYSSDTDLILDFANAVAKIVKKTYPDRLLNVLSYAPTVAAPSAVHPVESNVEIMFCTETSMTKPTAEAGYIGLPGWKQQIPWKTNMQNYIARTNVKHVAVWKWLCIAANSYSGDWGKMPWVQGNVATEDHAFWKSMGATYVFYDQGPHTAYREYDNSFPLRWPLWYVANRGCWTQDKTGEQLLRDACEKLYGKGADAMLAYYMALADASEACTVESYAWIPCAPSDVYTPAQVKIIDARIAEAKKMLDSVTKDQAKRMENQIKLWEKAKTYL